MKLKDYKEKLIKLNYELNGCDHSQTGVITAYTQKQILFRPNSSDLEIRLRHSQIKGHEIIFTFKEQKKQFKRLIQLNKPNEAMIFIKKMEQDFKRPEQLTEIQKLKFKTLQSIAEKNWLNNNLVDAYSNYNEMLQIAITNEEKRICNESMAIINYERTKLA